MAGGSGVSVGRAALGRNGGRERGFLIFAALRTNLNGREWWHNLTKICKRGFSFRFYALSSLGALLYSYFMFLNSAAVFILKSMSAWRAGVVI